MFLKDKILTMVILFIFCCSLTGFAKDREYENYRQVVKKTANMVYDQSVQKLVHEYGLNILNLTWEDTGRYKNSCVGPNISDMTIQIQQMDPETKRYFLTCMPVIRYPNFSDKTADISPEKFYLLVGNEKGKKLKKITLKKFLENIPKYLSDPKSWKAKNPSMLSNRDTHVLVSAQACFLPVPAGGKAEFNPVLFNYQSYKNDPAVLTILVTREGTSVTIIDNVRDSFQAGRTWGQRLFFNQNGERASFTGERLSDFNKNKEKRIVIEEEPTATANKESGLNMVLLIQIPLKQKNPMVFPPYAGETIMFSCDKVESKEKSNVEAAVIGHGKVEGPFTEIDNLEIERDHNFPIRVTVQYYKATDNGVISKEDIKEIRAQIDKTYANADYVGSLVIEGETTRPTEYNGSKIEPPNWWQEFWKHYKERFLQDKS